MAKVLQQIFDKCIPLITRKTLQRNFLRDIRRMNLSLYQDKDPAPFFFDANIQNILKSLTSLDMNKLFHNIKTENAEDTPIYKFVTDGELKEHMEKSQVMADKMLQMPPIVKVRKEIDEVLSKDPLIRHDMTNRIIFTDVTFGLSDMERLIVVRETDGTLRRAHWEERERMNQIYVPQPGRKLKAPKAFQHEYLMGLLDQQEYRFILDYACVQFDPDNPEYQRISAEVYERIDLESHYDALASTRHFGPFCFYLVWNKKVDNLLINYIHNQRVDHAVKLVKLHYFIHYNACPEETPGGSEGMNLLKKYAEEESSVKPNLILALQTLLQYLDTSQEPTEEQTSQEPISKGTT